MEIDSRIRRYDVIVSWSVRVNTTKCWCFEVTNEYNVQSTPSNECRVKVLQKWDPWFDCFVGDGPLSNPNNVSPSFSLQFKRYGVFRRAVTTYNKCECKMTGSFSALVRTVVVSSLHVKKVFYPVFYKPLSLFKLESGDELVFLSEEREDVGFMWVRRFSLLGCQSSGLVRVTGPNVLSEV